MDSGRRIQLLSLGVGKSREGYSPVAWLHACLLLSSPLCSITKVVGRERQRGRTRVLSCFVEGDPYAHYTQQWSDAPRLRHPVGLAEDPAL